MHNSMVTTALTLPGYRIVKNIGVVRGITVRSRSIIGNFFGGLQSLFGGNITIYTSLCERARSDTYQLMCEHAVKQGANAIISMRYDATDLSGSRYFCESFYGHPCPTSGKNYTTANAYGGPSRPGHSIATQQGVAHMLSNDSTRFRKACIFTSQAA